MQTQQLHQRALAEDASVFDYDGVYEEMKGKTQARGRFKETLRLQVSRNRRLPSLLSHAPAALQGTAQEKKAARPQSKYIAQLKLKAEERNREQDVVFERCAARRSSRFLSRPFNKRPPLTERRRQIKEREKEDHLYGDKEKFVTSAYKKKLEEARAPQIRADAKA